MAKRPQDDIRLIRIPPIPTGFVRRTVTPFSVDAYLVAKRNGKEADAGIPCTDWLDQLFAISETLTSNGLSGQVFAGALDLNAEAIDSACLALLEKLAEVRRVGAAGAPAPTRRGLIASEALIKHLAVMLVEILHFEQEPTPETMAVLLRELMGGTNTELIQSNLPENKEPKIFAAQLLAQCPKIGVRSLAKALNLSPSTISRWIKDSDFQREIRFWAEMFDGSLSLRPAKRKRRSKPVADD
jgi:hypothetical protein